jgi:hypothetical protein
VVGIWVFVRHWFWDNTSQGNTENGGTLRYKIGDTIIVGVPKPFDPTIEFWELERGLAQLHDTEIQVTITPELLDWVKVNQR